MLERDEAILREEETRVKLSKALAKLQELGIDPEML